MDDRDLGQGGRKVLGTVPLFKPCVSQPSNLAADLTIHNLYSMSNFFDKSINKAPIQYLTIAADDTIKLEILRK